MISVLTSSGTDLDVQGIDAQFLASNSDILSCQHCCVWGGLVTIGLDLHSSGDTGDGFATTITSISVPEKKQKANPIPWSKRT